MGNQTLDVLIEYFQSQPIKKAWIFGSFSRGEETEESDIDIMVSFLPNAKVGLFKFFDIKEELEVILGRQVDLVTESSLLPFAEKSVMHDRKLIYERAS